MKEYEQIEMDLSFSDNPIIRLYEKHLRDKQNKLTEYDIKISMIPHLWDNVYEPYFWVILGYSSDWYNCGCGWSKSPKEAFQAAQEHYNRVILKSNETLQIKKLNNVAENPEDRFIIVCNACGCTTAQLILDIDEDEYSIETIKGVEIICPVCNTTYLQSLEDDKNEI